METISPELVLVDAMLRSPEPDTADESRDSGGRSLQPNRAHRPQSPTAPEIARRAALGRARGICLPQRAFSRRVLALSLSVALLIVALAGMELGRDGPKAAGEQVSAVIEPGSAQRITDEGPGGTADIRLNLRWRPVKGAAFYNVILWRNGVRALDLWPRKSAIDLSGSRVPPGAYRWYVYPAFRTQRGPRYGPVVAQGRLRV